MTSQEKIEILKIVKQLSIYSIEDLKKAYKEIVELIG